MRVGPANIVRIVADIKKITILHYNISSIYKSENMDLTKKVRDMIAQEGLMFAYRGPVTAENSALLLTLLDKEMELSDYAFVGRKRLFIFVLENLQNLTRHALKSEHDMLSLVVYKKTEDGYTITTGNAIQKEDVVDLNRRLIEINSLDPEQIKEAYREVLQDSSISNKGGAGLGLLEMARKTGNRLDFDFRHLDNEHDYFILSKTVDAGGKGEREPGEKVPYDGQKIKFLEELMVRDGLYFIWSGHISNDIRQEMLNLNEVKLLDDDIGNNLQKRVFTVLIELLQNIAEHSPGYRAEEDFGMPVAAIRAEKSSYIIISGNLVRNEDVTILKKKLDLINKHDEAGLRTLLRQGLEEQDMQVKTTGYLGLLEMARRSGEKLKYVFQTVNDDYSYYVITVRVSSKNAS